MGTEVVAFSLLNICLGLGLRGSENWFNPRRVR